ncbi:MAG TPA: flagellar motor protein MotB [Deltaproteobacteria bacterium]|nr:flagellar motor protein MotB [Deltaproteobacteria bacterium]HCP45372.1 flagellar motor protein MotB [Deltaproteobacteria bacterium]
MASPEQRAEKQESEGAPAWMVTFADLMTLLLTFFVLLLSMSTLDNQRIKLALGSLRGALGVLEGGGQPREGRKEISKMPRVAQGEMKLMTTLETFVEKEMNKVSNDFIQIGHKDTGVFIALDDSLMFPPGEVDILPTAFPFLSSLSQVLAASKANIEFVGHADSAEPGGGYSSNWEVAAARALAVLMYVQENGPIDGARLKASTKGEFSPRADNASTAGQAINRRVEIVLTVSTASDKYFYGDSTKIRELETPGGAEGTQ